MPPCRGNHPMKRKQLLIVGLVVAAAAIYVAQNRLQAAADRAAEAPMFEVDPFWPQPLPNHWVLGSVVGVGVDSRDHVFIVHRQAPLNERTEIGAVAGSAHRRVLRAGPVRARVRPGGQPGQLLGRARRGVHLARVQPRDHRRPDGQHLDRGQRRGLARPQVLARRGVPRVLRRGGRRHAQQQQRQLLRARGQDLLRRRSQRGVPGRRLQSTSAWPCWTSTPAN